MTDRDWRSLSEPAWQVAPRLLGSLLVRELNGHRLVGKIVETEAYDQTDEASHSYHGRTLRTNVMFGSAGHLYVYLSYGVHYCCNVVTGRQDHGSAVLIRAIAPVEGVEAMRLLRSGALDSQLTNGPGKVCQALGIDKQLNGHDLHYQPLVLIIKDALPSNQIVQTTRVGITKARDKLWRFYVKDSAFVSKG
jgi:DNA-3-methyladenine glycosylase